VNSIHHQEQSLPLKLKLLINQEKITLGMDSTNLQEKITLGTDSTSLQDQATLLRVALLSKVKPVLFNKFNLEPK
jgi:hypothetical protein